MRKDQVSTDGSSDEPFVKSQPRFSTAYMDESVDPRTDIYRYACGKWLRENPVPPNKVAWGTFSALREWNLWLLRGIAEERELGRDAPCSPCEGMVGRFYASALDAERMNRIRFAPIGDLWQAIEGISSADDIRKLLPVLHLSGIGAFFTANCDADAKNSDIYALYFWQGGLSLPDRDYYILDSFAKKLQQFREHVQRMFALKGIDDATSRAWAGTVAELETEIAKSSRTSAELRDSEKNYNKVQTGELDGSYPSLKLMEYLKGAGVPPLPYVVVGQPEFMAAVDRMLAERPVEQWAVYLRWHVLASYAPFLHKEARDESFDFFRRKLLGQEKPEPEWKRAIAAIDNGIGEALGKLYVERNFGSEAKARVEVLVRDIIAAFRRKLETAQWMSDGTRRLALKKLDRMEFKIGFPAKFRDYSGLMITDDDYVGNIRRSAGFELGRQMARAGKPVDRDEWYMTPPTVNAYYSDTQNELVLPAGILQPPYFDVTMDDAVNYAGIGTIIGHEITHGFDDEGRKYDADGNLCEWWVEEDKNAFNRRAEAVAEAYSAIEALPGMFINGKLTLGESIADLGGAVIAYDALQRRFAEEPSRKKRADGFTAE